MNADAQTRDERFQFLVALLNRIIRGLQELKTDVDEIDRTLRPHGDGVKLSRRRS